VCKLGKRCTDDSRSDVIEGVMIRVHSEQVDETRQEFAAPGNWFTSTYWLSVHVNKVIV